MASATGSAAGLEKPDGPKNKKGRPFGSGTTNQKRRENRAKLQWSNLEQADPTSPSCLIKHLRLLEEAKEKCQQKLADRLQEAIDAQDAAASSSGGPAKKQKSLEKDTANKMGKKGPRAAVLTPAQEVLEKTQQEELEEVVETVLVKTKNGIEEVVLEKTKGKAKAKAKGMVLEEKPKGKAKGKEGLEKPKGKGKGNEGLEKPSTYKEALEKAPKVKAKPKKDLEKSQKPLVVVDWHNTLEVNEDVSGRNSYALTLLLQRCDVLIMSYVATTKRQEAVLRDIDALPHWRTSNGKLEKMVCWRKTGQSGKTDLAMARGAIGIFDDSKPICQEALQWGLQVFAIQTEWQQHDWLPQPWVPYSSFADAVDGFIKNNFYQ